MLLDELRGTQDVAEAIGTKGLLSARPAAGTMGRFYHATDVGALYRDSGSAWELVAVAAGAGAFSARPAAGVIGRFYEATDQSVLYRDTGSAWQAIIFPLSGTLAARPTPAVAGRHYLATDVKVMYVDNASAWEPVPAVLAAGLLAARPASAVEGRFYKATDNGVLYRDTGASAWDYLLLNGGSSSGTLAARPAAGVAGRWYLTTDTNTLYRDNGAAWEVPGGEPGELIFSAALNVPGRVLKCEGQPVSRATFAALWKALGETSSPYGQGDGVNTFNLPDFRERVPMGPGTTNAVGAKVGANSKAISSAEMPSHTHGISVSAVGNHSHQVYPYVSGGANNGSPGRTTVFAPGWALEANILFVAAVVNFEGFVNQLGNTDAEGEHTHAASAAATGGGAERSNLQASTVCNVWIRF